MVYIKSSLMVFCLICMVTACKAPTFVTQSTLFNHNAWDSFLQKHVQSDGWVDYAAMKNDEKQLDGYLKVVSEHPPHGPEWTEDDKLAYWINAYNAFTVKLILDHYPISSIKDIKKGIAFVNSVWDIKFIKIGSKEMDLTTIEHGILRKEFDEPRIHFAINCASVSCPKLLNRAFQANIIDKQLEQVAISFVNDPNRNRLSPNKIEISKIFSWFKGDFTKKMDLISFLNQYSTIEIKSSADIEHLDYSWKLNGVENRVDH